MTGRAAVACSFFITLGWQSTAELSLSLTPASAAATLQVNLGKVEKQLDELRGRWDELKKRAPQVGMGSGLRGEEKKQCALFAQSR